MEMVRFSKHAGDMLRERRLPKDPVVETVLRPDQRNPPVVKCRRSPPSRGLQGAFAGERPISRRGLFSLP